MSDAHDSAETIGQVCDNCGAVCPLDAKWCEACGTDLAASDVPEKSRCVSCDAPGHEITDDGWCQMCGTKQPAPDDHVIADHGWFAMVSDRGRVHRSNEDAGAVAARPEGVALVVCDGVSTTDESQDASQNAVRTIIKLLAEARFSDAETAIVDAAAAAQAEIVEVTSRSSSEPPSCTMVSAIVETTGDQGHIVLGWLGDSRAYWIGDGRATQLTQDHSWAVEQHELGELDADTIDADSRAHSITRWLGADSHDVVPQIHTRQVQLPGILLVCSDGLWNYAQTEQEMHDLVIGQSGTETALESAERLVAFANERGGHDNITVAIAQLKSHDRGTPDQGTQE